MNVFILGLRITATAAPGDNNTINVLAEALPSNDRKVATKVQLIQKENHYVGKLLSGLEEKQTVLALGPTRPTPDGVLQMQPIIVITEDNFDDLLAVNIFMMTGGLGPKTEEVELTDTSVTNRSLAWPSENGETSWAKITAWAELSKQLSELAPGTPTIAVGKVSTSEKEDKQYLNYNVDKIMYLPKSTKSAPKKAADPEKGKVAVAALGSIDFSL